MIPTVYWLLIKGYTYERQQYCSGDHLTNDYQYDSLNAAGTACNSFSSCKCIGKGVQYWLHKGTETYFRGDNFAVWVIPIISYFFETFCKVK